jgi:HTH-type transcriptional regulator / antitoxin HipB
VEIEAILHHLDEQYGKRGTKEREEFEEGFESFKIGVMLQELRKEQGLTQEQLAEKCGTTKTYNSRIENDASDIRLSTLMRIIRQGFGRHLKMSVENLKKHLAIASYKFYWGGIVDFKALVFNLALNISTAKCFAIPNISYI